MKGQLSSVVTTEEHVRIDLEGKNPLDALVALFQRLDNGWQVTAVDIHFRRSEATYFGPPRPRRLARVHHRKALR